MWYSLKLGLILISGTWLISNLGNSVFIDTQGQAAELYFFPKESKSECTDLGKNCSSRKHLCKNESLLIQMKNECAFTCNFCSPKKAPNFGISNEIQIINGIPRIQIVDESSKIPIIDEAPFPILPDIQSVDDISAVKKVVKSASSLSKTIIQGTCFDEYIYCGEFISMCDQEEYEELMSRHCSLTCGRCDVQHKERETCEDYAECEGMSPLCNHHIYKETVQKQCRKTCGICKPDSVGCEDRHKNCKAFKDDGFCENPIYSTDERSYLCGTTCGLCQDSN